MLPLLLAVLFVVRAFEEAVRVAREDVVTEADVDVDVVVVVVVVVVVDEDEVRVAVEDGKTGKTPVFGVLLEGEGRLLFERRSKKKKRLMPRIYLRKFSINIVFFI